MSMSSNAVPMQRLCLATALFLALSLPAAAQWPPADQEPYGEPIQGWRVTQDMDKGKAVCRAYSPGPTQRAVVRRDGDGKFLLQAPAPNVPKGKIEEANFEAGGDSEMVNGWATGSALYLEVDDHIVGLLVKAGRYEWAVNGRNQVGAVVFNSALGAVVKRLRECTKANGGR